LKVLICVPAFGYQNSSETTKSLVALTKEFAERGIFGGFATHSFPDIVDLRNVFLSIFYEAIDATHLLFVDADMRFEPELVRDMLLADKPLIGALYPKKRLPLSWVGSPIDPPAEPENGLLELEGIGCGVMLIRRDCIEDMIAAGTVQVQDDLRGTALVDLLNPYGVKRIIRAFDKVTTPEGRQLSEDFSLCWRHRQAGGRVYAPINHMITHLGTYPFSGRYSDMYEMKEAAE
jgi:hypothetical protein